MNIKMQITEDFRIRTINYESLESPPEKFPDATTQETHFKSWAKKAQNLALALQEAGWEMSSTAFGQTIYHIQKGKKLIGKIDYDKVSINGRSKDISKLKTFLDAYDPQ